jgi:hypothetical protein
VRCELDELELEDRFYSFNTPAKQMSVEEREAFEVCQQANQIAFGHILKSKDPLIISRLAFYILDQGLRCIVAEEIHTLAQEDKQIANQVEDKINSTHKQRQQEMWSQLIQMCSEALLKD